MKRWTNNFSVGIYKCLLIYDRRKGLRTEWSPDLPRRNLSEQELNQYRAGRDALLAEVGKELGGSVLILEV